MEPTPQQATAQEPLAATPAIADAMERLLAHPELLASVASAIGLGKPPSAQESPPVPQGSETPSDTTETSLSVSTPPSADLGEAVAAFAPLLSAFTGKGDAKANDPRSCLLRALKPYVSHNRAQAIDTILRLSLVSEAFKKMK